VDRRIPARAASRWDLTRPEEVYEVLGHNDSISQDPNRRWKASATTWERSPLVDHDSKDLHAGLRGRKAEKVRETKTFSAVLSSAIKDPRERKRRIRDRAAVSLRKKPPHAGENI